tara:strand:- start:712 stop:1143 length:432 start_codon:yes stop_codon:yes gene_type:complete
MIELLSQTWLLIAGVFGSLWDLGSVLLTWVWSVLLILHHDMPRVEGLLVGIIFAWLYTHRERSPWVRALAAPLKIILDTLDIIWDETIEAIVDLAGDVRERTQKCLGYVKEKISGTLALIVGKLQSVKGWVSQKLKKEDKESE